MQAQDKCPVEAQLMVGAQHAAVVEMNMEALMDRDPRGVDSATTVSDHDLGAVVTEGSRK